MGHFMRNISSFKSNEHILKISSFKSNEHILKKVVRPYYVVSDI